MQSTDLGGTLKNLCLTLFVERYQLESERCEKEGIDHVGYGAWGVTVRPSHLRNIGKKMT